MVFERDGTLYWTKFVTFTTSLSESCFSDVTTVSSDKSDDRCSETNDFGDDVYIAVGISNTEKTSSSDISDDGDERLSLSHAVDKKEISTGMLLEDNGERGGKIYETVNIDGVSNLILQCYQ
jgi:hypothetical protein